MVVANISSTIGFGFVNAFPDYDRNRLWLFGTPADRCHGNCGGCTGASCPGRPSCTSIQSWWTSLPVPSSFETAVAIPAGTAELKHTYNQGVARVRVPGPGMPPHGYVMISEPVTPPPIPSSTTMCSKTLIAYTTWEGRGGGNSIYHLGRGGEGGACHSAGSHRNGPPQLPFFTLTAGFTMTSSRRLQAVQLLHQQ